MYDHGKAHHHPSLPAWAIFPVSVRGPKQSPRSSTQYLPLSPWPQHLGWICSSDVAEACGQGSGPEDSVPSSSPDPYPHHRAWHLSYVPGKRERSQGELSRTTWMSRLHLEGPPKGRGASRPLGPRPTPALEPAPQSFWKGPCLPPGEFRQSF